MAGTSVQPNTTNMALGAVICASLGACAAWGCRLLGLTRSSAFRHQEPQLEVQGATSPHQLSPEELRQKASIHAENRNSYFAQSQAAYRAGNKGLAKELSDKGKEEQALMDQFNAAAANMFLDRNNKSTSTDEIDLHGLHVKEAIAVVEEKLKEAKREKKKFLVFIVGVGNHSAGGVVKLKPAIEKLMEQYCLACTPGVPRKGCLYVELDAAKSGWSQGAEAADKAGSVAKGDGCVIC